MGVGNFPWMAFGSNLFWKGWMHVGNDALHRILKRKNNGVPSKGTPCA